MANSACALSNVAPGASTPKTETATPERGAWPAMSVRSGVHTSCDTGWDSGSGTPAAPDVPSPQHALLEDARDKPGDPDLGLLFNELNALHFDGVLPNVKVLWDAGLDRLDEGDYRLNGMTDGKIILLKAALKDVEDDVRRTLCHEMVHVKFLADGNKSTAHDKERRRLLPE